MNRGEKRALALAMHTRHHEDDAVAWLSAGLLAFCALLISAHELLAYLFWRDAGLDLVMGVVKTASIHARSSGSAETTRCVPSSSVISRT
jgi:hypothetical protein